MKSYAVSHVGTPDTLKQAIRNAMDEFCGLAKAALHTSLEVPSELPSLDDVIRAHVEDYVRNKITPFYMDERFNISCTADRILTRLLRK